MIRAPALLLLCAAASVGAVACGEPEATEVGGDRSDAPQTATAEAHMPPCPVTIPPTPGFTPPPPHPGAPAEPNSVWFGSPALWTVLSKDGTYARRKSVWWSSGFRGGRLEQEPEIEVTWRRLDPPTRVVAEDGPGTNAFTHEAGWFMIAGIDPEDPGCWEVTATYRGARLSYTYLLR